MQDHYDRMSQPITFDRWVQLHGGKGNLDYIRVALDNLDGAVEVSTVWLGINHNFMGDGPPLIFETMIFGGKYDQWQWRYSTEEEALEGHRKVVQVLIEGGDPGTEIGP